MGNDMVGTLMDVKSRAPHQASAPPSRHLDQTGDDSAATYHPYTFYTSNLKQDSYKFATRILRGQTFLVTLLERKILWQDRWDTLILLEVGRTHRFIWQQHPQVSQLPFVMRLLISCPAVSKRKLLLEITVPIRLS